MNGWTVSEGYRAECVLGDVVFFFKQKTAYEMLRSLVGSEMCIRDRSSSKQKRDLTLELGADVAVDSRSENLREDILAANGGKMVDVVLEMAGGQAFEDCLRALAPFGRLVTFGIASREENTVKTGHLMRNSRAVIGFWMVHVLSNPELAKAGIERVLGAAARGELRTVVGGVHSLSDAREVHRNLAERKTIGKILLDPSL